MDANLQKPAWDREILYADRASKERELSVRPFLREINNENVEENWILEFIFCSMETTHEPLHLDK
jgi:hypothetical protein